MMPVELLRHVTIFTKDVEETSKFLKTALGFTDGYTSGVDFPLAWLTLDTVQLVFKTQF